MNQWEQPGFERQRDGVQGYLHSFKKEVLFPGLHQDLRPFHMEMRPEVLRILSNEHKILGPIKFKLEGVVNLRKETNDGVERIRYFTVQKTPALLNVFNVPGVVRKLNEILEEQLEVLAEHNDRGSVWIFDGIEKVYLKTSRYKVLRGGSYISLPKFIQKKNAVINIKNKDNKCLRWAMKAAKFPVEVHPERTSKYPKDIDDGFDFTGISFPTPLSEIPEVERLNNIAINVLNYNEKKKTDKINILYVSELEEENVHKINLLHARKGDATHYCYVKSLSRLLYGQQQSNGHHYHYCVRCLKGFSVQGTKTRLHNARVPEHKFNNRELHTQHIFLTTQQDRYWGLIFG